MMERLGKVHPVINRQHLEESFEKHLKAEGNLRRRQMKPLSLPKDLHADSSTKNRFSTTGDSDFHFNGNTSSELFDSSMYSSQRSKFSGGTALRSLDNSPIKNVTDFRKQVIASKKLKKSEIVSSEELLSEKKSSQDYSSPSIHVGESKMSLDSQPDSSVRSKRWAKPDTGSLYEITYNP
jgi:hypothetical protein